MGAGNEVDRFTKRKIASSGWNTLSGVIAMKPDNELDIDKSKNYCKEL
jgi:hypothetical protein